MVHCAAGNGQYRAVRLLISKKCDVHAKNAVMNYPYRLLHLLFRDLLTSPDVSRFRSLVDTCLHKFSVAVGTAFAGKRPCVEKNLFAICADRTAASSYGR